MVELLVVIAIIALLAALLMPALNKAKETGRSAVCMSNLRQHFLACSFYSQDNSDSCLPAYQLGAGIWQGILVWKGYLPSGKNKIDIRVKRDLRCPSNSNGFYNDSDNPQSVYGVDHIGGSPNYMYNWSTIIITLPDASDAYPRRLASISNPARKAMLADSRNLPNAGILNFCNYAFDRNLYRWDPTSAGYLLADPHNRRSNVLFFDGHVESFAPGTIDQTVGDLDLP